MRDEAGLLVGWGIGTATFPALMFTAEARAVVHGDGSGVMGNRRPRTWVRAPGPALAQIAADRTRLDIDRWSSGRAHPICRTRHSPAARRTPRPPAWAIHNAGAAMIAKPRDLATGDERSPLFGAGNAGVVARGGPPVSPRR